MPSNIAATKESLLISIITADAEETIALRRTVGIEADNNIIDENEIEIRSVINELCTKHHVSTENVLSQTIFLNGKYFTKGFILLMVNIFLIMY